MQVIIMSGISGSGKSSYIREHYPNAKVVSTDNFFMVNGEYRFDPADLGKAHAQCLLNFVVGLVSDYPIIVVDNTNLTAIEIAPYYSLAKAYGAEVKLVTLFVSIEVCFNRNKHGVPLETCQRMAEALKAREIPCYWDLELKCQGRSQ
jgi:predicted kinase